MRAYHISGPYEFKRPPENIEHCRNYINETHDNEDSSFLSRAPEQPPTPRSRTYQIVDYPS